MAYDITRLKQDLEGVLHGTTTNQITNLNGLINRAGRQLLLDVDPQETARTLPFVNPIFSSVYDYALPVDLKGNKVIDIKPQVNRQLTDIASQTYNQVFDVTKGWTFAEQFTINWNTAVKTIRLSEPNLPPPIVVNQADTITGNGTWSTGDSASNLQVDNINFAAGSGSLSFDLAASGSDGYLVNSTSQTINLTNLVNQGTMFLFTYLPTASSFTSVTLRWGSDSSDYYEVSTSVTQQNTSFENGWNLLAFNWLGATVVGTPDPSNITYLQVIWNYDGTAQTAVRLDGITCSLGTILNIEYYSKYLFRDAITGAFQETVTDDSNLINLDTESYNLLFNQVAYLAAQQQQGIDAAFHDGPMFQALYIDGLKRYQAMYKSQVQKPQSIYYQKPNPNFQRYFNQWNP